MTTWSLVYDDFSPEQEKLREALCTLGNGYFATRGAAPESRDDGTHYPGTYLAGGYNRLCTRIGDHVVENEDLINMPNWLPLTFRIEEGDWFDLTAVEILSYRQELDLKSGILVRTIHFRDAGGRETRVIQRRLVHMREEHMAALETRITAQNWSGQLEIRSALDGRVVNNGVERYKGLNNRHLEVLTTEALGDDTLFLKARTRQSRIEIAQAARTRCFRSYERLASPLAIEPGLIREPDYIGHQYAIPLTEGDEIIVEKIVAVYTSRDHAICECGLEARKAAARAGRFGDLLAGHALVWKQLWYRFDIAIEMTDPTINGRTLMIMRLHIFHLLQTASENTMDLDTGVPARGWHGEAYRGHIFWDELFVFPLLNLRIPEITRELLMYRYRRLPEARIAAREAGYHGAMYPWQSGSNGREESQKLHLNPKSGRWIPDRTHLQRHVNAAIAYNVWQYYQVSDDLEFLSFYGAEMILEIARFWASLSTYNQELDRYEILGVMGPDEYHDAYPEAEEPGLNNNAYTNIMAVWVVCRALEVLELLPEDRCLELKEILNLTPEELGRWEEISRKMRVVFHDEGIISQFEGYEQLREFDWEGYRERYGDNQRLDRILEAENDSPNRYQVSKQADVLMLFYLLSAERLGELFDRLGYPFEHDTIPRNIDYYLNRTSHGSTLSQVVHSWVMARSDRPRSWRLFIEALKSDVADIQGGTTPEGIHLGAMASTVDLMQRGYTGIVTRQNVLWFNPSLPEEVGCLRMRLHYRGHALELLITDHKLRIRSTRCTARPIRIALREEVYELKGGETRDFEL
jgi:alpha,alpha-trehalase